MEKLLKPYDREYMRMAMLKHEETFKQQLYELHRLYRIQKILMKNIESTRCTARNQLKINRLDDAHQKSRTIENFRHFVDENKASLDINVGTPSIIDESEIELTLGPANYMPTKKTGTPPRSDHGWSFFSSSSSGCSQKTREIFSGFEVGLVNVSDGVSTIRSIPKKSVSEEQPRRDKVETRHWLFQPLSLNMT